MSPSLMAIWASLPRGSFATISFQAPKSSWGIHDCWAAEWLGIPAFQGITVPRVFLAGL